MLESEGKITVDLEGTGIVIHGTPDKVVAVMERLQFPVVKEIHFRHYSESKQSYTELKFLETNHLLNAFLKQLDEDVRDLFSYQANRREGLNHLNFADEKGFVLFLQRISPCGYIYFLEILRRTKENLNKPSLLPF